MQTQAIAKNADVEPLNTLLRGELAAAETYRRALLKLPTSHNIAVFQECGRSHADRASVLAGEIQSRGGLAATSSGLWGAFAEAFEGSAQLFGERGAILALAEGERHGKQEYLDALSELNSTARTLIEHRLFPEQLRTHDLITNLKQHGN